MGDGIVAGFVHLFSIHKREGEGFESSMDMHEVEGGNRGSLGDEGDISGNEVFGANLVDEDGGLEVVSF